MLRLNRTPRGLVHYESCARGYLSSADPPADYQLLLEASKPGFDSGLIRNVGSLLQVFEASGCLNGTGDYDGIVGLGWADKTPEGGSYRVALTAKGIALAEQILRVAKASKGESSEEYLLGALEPIAKKYRVSAQSLRAVWYLSRGMPAKEAKGKITRADGRGYIASNTYVSILADQAIHKLCNSGVLTYRTPEGQRYPSKQDKCRQVVEFFLSETPYTLNLGEMPKLQANLGLLPGKVEDSLKMVLRMLDEIAATARSVGLDPNDVFVMGKDGRVRPGRLLKLYDLPPV